MSTTVLRAAPRDTIRAARAYLALTDIGGGGHLARIQQQRSLAYRVTKKIARDRLSENGRMLQLLPPLQPAPPLSGRATLAVLLGGSE